MIQRCSVGLGVEALCPELSLCLQQQSHAGQLSTHVASPEGVIHSHKPNIYKTLCGESKLAFIPESVKVEPLPCCWLEICSCCSLWAHLYSAELGLCAWRWWTRVVVLVWYVLHKSRPPERFFALLMVEIGLCDLGNYRIAIWLVLLCSQASAQYCTVAQFIENRENKQ